jgi:hypothetical protein
MFGWSLNTNLGSADQKLVALITLALITILNIYGVKLVAIVNNTGVVFEILGMVVFAIFLAIVHNNQGAGVIFDSAKSGNIFEFPAPVSVSFFLVGMFMSLYVIYGFDTASTLAEETRNPRVEAPKAVLGSVIGAFVIGAIFLWGVLIAVPDMGAAVTSFATGPQQVIEAVMSSFGSTLVPADRVGRDLRVLHVDPDIDDPAGIRHGPRRSAAVLEVPVEGEPEVAHAGPHVRRRGAALAVPFIQFAGAAVIAVGATASIYLSYLLGNLAFMRASDEGMAQDVGAVQARQVGHGREPDRDPVGRGDDAELPHAGLRELRRGTRTLPAPTTCASSRTRSRSRPTTTWRAISSSTSRSAR